MTANLYNYDINYDFPHNHLLKLEDYSADDILNVIALALKLKKESKQGITHEILKGKKLAMIFAKSSTRTRVSFEVGIAELGGIGIFLNTNDLQLGRGETISDTAKVLSRYVDGIMIRTFKHSDVEGLAKHGSIPIINGLTDDYHPCQVLCDLMTIYEKKGTLNGLKMAFIGDGNNMVNSLMTGCAKVGMDITVASPNDYLPEEEYVYAAKNICNSKVNITTDPKKAMQDADVVYGDVWASMGQEGEDDDRMSVFAPYQVDEKLFSLAKEDAIYMHCLPAHRGEEVTKDVIDGVNSVIFDQAENRLHVQKAAMALLMA